MKLDKEKASAVFFGKVEVPTGYLIITPIGKIYKRIKTRYPVLEESKGWWKRAKINIGSKTALVFKIPPGPCIKDCLEVLDFKATKKIIFLGFCGALNEKLKIGAIAIPREEKYKIASTSQMILKETFLQKFKKQGIDFLDMETQFLYRWGQQHRVPTISVLIISDKPRSLPFFACGQKEIRLIDKAISKVVNDLNQCLT